MQKLKSYVGLALIGGLLIILPLAVFILAGRWVLGLFSDLVSPVSDPLSNTFGLSPLFSDVLVIAIFLVVCFLVGILVRTAFGRWMHNTFDELLIRLAPGYKTIKGMIQQLIGGTDTGSLLRGEVVLARLFGPDCETTATGIVTSKHKNGMVTVYIPTAPVPTSGLTYHLPANSVEYLTGVTAEEAMRTIISCGAGSAEMLLNKNKEIESIPT
jgi:uncharacterized membrane protein